MRKSKDYKTGYSAGYTAGKRGKEGLPWVPGKKPPESGGYFIAVPSADPKQPFYGYAWFDRREGWVGIPMMWASAVSHYFKVEVPKGE